MAKDHTKILQNFICSPMARCSLHHAHCPGLTRPERSQKRDLRDKAFLGRMLFYKHSGMRNYAV